MYTVAAVCDKERRRFTPTVLGITFTGTPFLLGCAGSAERPFSTVRLSTPFRTHWRVLTCTPRISARSTGSPGRALRMASNKRRVPPDHRDQEPHPSGDPGGSGRSARPAGGRGGAGTRPARTRAAVARCVGPIAASRSANVPAIRARWEVRKRRRDRCSGCRCGPGRRTSARAGSGSRRRARPRPSTRSCWRHSTVRVDGRCRQPYTSAV